MNWRNKMSNTLKRKIRRRAIASSPQKIELPRNVTGYVLFARDALGKVLFKHPTKSKWFQDMHGGIIKHKNIAHPIEYLDTARSS